MPSNIPCIVLSLLSLQPTHNNAQQIILKYIIKKFAFGLFSLVVNENVLGNVMFCTVIMNIKNGCFSFSSISCGFSNEGLPPNTNDYDTKYGLPSRFDVIAFKICAYIRMKSRIVVVHEYKTRQLPGHEIKPVKSVDKSDDDTLNFISYPIHCRHKKPFFPSKLFINYEFWWANKTVCRHKTGFYGAVSEWGKNSHLLLLDLVTYKSILFLWCVLQTRQTSAIIKAMCRNKLSQLNAHGRFVLN